MKHLLSGAIGAMIGVIFMWLWWPGAECSEERATITALSERNDKAQWEAKLVQHRLAKTQRELGAQLAQKVGKVDDVMKANIKDVKAIPCGDVWPASACDTMSKVDEEVSSITALAKSLAPVETAVKEVAKQQDSFLPVPWLKQQIMNSAKLAGGRWK